VGTLSLIFGGRLCHDISIAFKECALKDFADVSFAEAVSKALSLLSEGRLRYNARTLTNEPSTNEPSTNEPSTNEPHTYERA